MAQSGKLETVVEIKAPAHKFYSVFRSEMHKLPNISSDKVHKVQVHEGDFETVGSVKSWNYTLEGKALSVKETMEKIDEENKSITFNALDGDMMKLYKSFKVTVQVTAKDGGSLVKWTIEFDKLNENVPSPGAYLDFAVNLSKDIEAHLLKA